MVKLFSVHMRVHINWSPGFVLELCYWLRRRCFGWSWYILVINKRYFWRTLKCLAFFGELANGWEFWEKHCWTLHEVCFDYELQDPIYFCFEKPSVLISAMWLLVEGLCSLGSDLIRYCQYFSFISQYSLTKSVSFAIFKALHIQLRTLLTRSFSFSQNAKATQVFQILLFLSDLQIEESIMFHS